VLKHTSTLPLSKVPSCPLRKLSGSFAEILRFFGGNVELFCRDDVHDEGDDSSLPPCNTLHHTASHCNSLQLTATHHETLQRTAR